MVVSWAKMSSVLKIKGEHKWRALNYTLSFIHVQNRLSIETRITISDDVAKALILKILQKLRLTTRKFLLMLHHQVRWSNLLVKPINVQIKLLHSRTEHEQWTQSVNSIMVIKVNKLLNWVIFMFALILWIEQENGSKN